LGGLLLGGVFLGLLLLSVLREELFVLLVGGTGVLVAVDGLLLDEVLAAETGLGNHALDVGRLVEGLVLALDFAGNYVLANIVLLFVEGEGLNDVVASLGAESVGTLDIGDTVDFTVTALDNSEEDDSEIGADDAAADGLSLALTGAGGLVAAGTYKSIR